jgi:N-acetylmuramoyl-L-alanine amidase
MFPQGGKVWAGLLGMLLLGLAAVPGHAQNPEPASRPLRVEGPAAKPWLTPLQEVSGVLVFPLRPGLEYLGGSMRWNQTLGKVVLEGPQGHSAEVVVGFPKALIDGKRWLRLPNLLLRRQGQVYISPEAFARLWREICDPAFQYNALTRTLAHKTGTPPPEPTVAAAQASPPAMKNFLAGLKCVVVDAGHGGKDPGAIGPTQLKEKAVTLEIAQQLAALLEQDGGCKVILTRSDDTFIPLHDRPEIANRAQADLFISIHANASLDRQARGTQVFIYNREASSRKAEEAARFENKDVNYLEIIKDDLRQSVHEVDSITLAGLIGQEVNKGLSETRQIERAPFYVLAKSHMPSVLVETAFISNPEEERKLRQKEFCLKMAQAIGSGLQEYAHEKNKP